MASPQRRGALVALIACGGAHLRLDVREQPRATARGRDEHGERLVELAAVEIRIEVTETRRQTAAHLAVGGGERPAAQVPGAVTQPEQRVELLDQLDGRRATPQRTDVDRHPSRWARRYLEHRIADVEAAAQVDVAIRPPSRKRHVAGWAQLLDQPVLEHERAELGARAAMVDECCARGPVAVARRGVKVRSRARPQRDRLADVERGPVLVAEQVDARLAGQGVELQRGTRPRRTRARHGRRAPPARAARRQQLDGVADCRRVCAEAPEQRAEDARARLRVRQRAMALGHLDAERGGQAGELALADQRCETARQRDRAQRRRVRPAQPLRRKRRAQHATVERSRMGDEHAPTQHRFEPAEHGSRRLRIRQHRFRDPGKPPDPTRQRLRHGDQRRVAVVQLAAADEHCADLRRLAGLAGAPVGLDVNGEKLGAAQRSLEQHPTEISATPDSVHVRLQAHAPFDQPHEALESALAAQLANRRRRDRNHPRSSSQ